MNNLLSYCGLFDARTSASEKDLPVTMIIAEQTKLSPNLTKPNVSLLSKIVQVLLKLEIFERNDFKMIHFRL